MEICSAFLDMVTTFYVTIMLSLSKRLSLCCLKNLFLKIGIFKSKTVSYIDLQKKIETKMQTISISSTLSFPH